MNISRLVAGAAVLCALPTTSRSTPLAIGWQPYTRVTPQDAALLIKSQSIKLHVHDVTVKEALEEVQRQTGLLIDTDKSYKTLDKKVSLNIETSSFKAATDAIFKAAGAPVFLHRGGWDAVWELEADYDPEKKVNAPVSEESPFQVRLQSLSSDQSATIELGNPTPRAQFGTLDAQLSIAPTPQISIFREPLLEITRAQDDQGRSLRPEAYYSINADLSCRVRFGSLSKDACRIAHLDGKVTYVLTSRREMWEVPDVLNAKGVFHDFQINGSSVRASLGESQKTFEGVEIGINIATITPAKQTVNTPTPLGVAVNAPVWQFVNIADLIQVLDAQGHPLRKALFTGVNDGNHLEGALHFFLTPKFVTPPQNGQPLPQRAMPNLAEPLKLTLESPSDLIQTEVPFSFSDIPLP